MGSVGNGQAGRTFIGTGVTSSPTFAVIGTQSGLTQYGVILGGGSGAFTAVNPGTSGYVLTSGGPGSPPTYLPVSSSGAVTTLTGNTGGALSPTAGNFNIVGTGSTTVVGSGSTLTMQMTGLTNHAVLVGAGTATITKVGPSATAGQILQSAGSSADPVFSTATYPSTAGSSGNVLTSDGTNWTSAAPAGADTYTFQLIGGQTNPNDSTTYYIAPGSWGITSNNSNKIWITKTGTITKVYGGVRVASTLGSSENSTVSIRLNDTSNTTVSSTVKFDSADSNFSNTGLSIAVTAGDFINIIIATPAWNPNPLSTFINVSVLIT